MAVRVTRNAGMLALAVYLIVAGVTGIAAVGLPTLALPILALLAGILILLGR